MFEAFAITLREGFEAALVVGLLLAFLKRTDRQILAAPVYWGIAAASAASAAAAVLLPGLVEKAVVNEETYEGTVKLCAAILMGTLLVWMWRSGRMIKTELEGKLGAVIPSAAAAAPRRAWMTAFLISFLAVFREGAEMVTMLATTSLSRDRVGESIGAGAGITLAVLFGVGLVRGSLKINFGRFFAFATLALAILTALMGLGAFHEFSEAAVFPSFIPSGPAEMKLVGPIVNSEEYFFAVILGVLAALYALGGSGGRAPAPAADNPAEARKQSWLEAVGRRWRAVLSGLAVSAGVCLVAFKVLSAPPGMAPAPALAPLDGELIVMKKDVGDGHLHFYSLLDGAREIRFIVVCTDTGAGEFKVTLDACILCGPKGYYERGPEIICRNCGAPINFASIGIPGGCNPVPVESRQTDAEIRIPVKNLISQYTFP